MGGAVSSGENNDDLVDNLIEANYIKNTSVERVFRAVDRACYYTDENKNSAYNDEAWKQGNLHLSAPCIYSQVMESLELGDGMSFLNLGSGTGYLSTMAGLILGSKGINHGIEYHSDVIEYAQERLQTFLKNNSAIDEYEFCVPQFQHGNCLSLGNTSRHYDRVYCGAACPELYENYMKQLLEIGGILVMPMNDQLLQIRRVEENGWTINSVLSVSFASLLLPAQDIAEDTTLPVMVPHSLRSLCRFEIRAVLKKNINSEHPTLWACSRKTAKQKKSNRPLRRSVVPLFLEVDSDTDSSIEMEPDVLNDDSESWSEGDDNNDAADRRSGVRKAESTRHVDDVTKTKREKFDSGVSDLFESTSESASSSSAAVESSASSSNPSRSIACVCQSHVAALSCNCAEEPETAGPAGEFGRIRLISHSSNGDRERSALVFFDRHPGEHYQTQHSKNDKEEEETVSDQDVDSSNVTPQQNYLFYMKQKLLDLPLPFALKSYLNYDRSF